MVILIGLDSQFVGVEAIVTVIMDLFPKLRKGYRREGVIFLYCSVSFLIGLTMVTNVRRGRQVWGVWRDKWGGGVGRQGWGVET